MNLQSWAMLFMCVVMLFIGGVMISTPKAKVTTINNKLSFRTITINDTIYRLTTTPFDIPDTISLHYISNQIVKEVASEFSASETYTPEFRAKVQKRMNQVYNSLIGEPK